MNNHALSLVPNNERTLSDSGGPGGHPLRHGPTSRGWSVKDLVRIARLHGNALNARAVRLLRDPTEASDVVQDCYERALRAGPRNMSDAECLSWLYVVLRNLCLDRFRSWNAHPEEPLPALDRVPISGDEPDDEPIWAELDVDDVHACLDTLKEPLRRVYELFTLHGQSYQQISRELDICPATVGTRMLRARRRLRRALLAQIAARRGQPAVDVSLCAAADGS